MKEMKKAKKGTGKHMMPGGMMMDDSEMPMGKRKMKGKKKNYK